MEAESGDSIPLDGMSIVFVDKILSPSVVRSKGIRVKESDIAILVERARAGNRSSFERLVSMFQPDIFRMAYYRTRSRMDAEDLTQDIFINAFKGLHKLKDVNSFKPWLFRIALNRVHDFHRKKRILVFLRDEGDGDEFEQAESEIHENPQAINHLIKEEFWLHISRFTGKLSRLEREAFILRFLDQLSIKEIARVLKKSESTVKTHLYRAIGKFKNNTEIISQLKGKTP